MAEPWKTSLRHHMLPGGSLPTRPADDPTAEAATRLGSCSCFVLFGDLGRNTPGLRAQGSKVYTYGNLGFRVECSRGLGLKEKLFLQMRISIS